VTEPPDPLLATDWRRLDARMLLVHPIQTLVRSFPALLVLLVARSGADDGQRWELYAVPLILAYGAARWLTTRYRIAGGQIELRRGVVTKQTTTARLDKVRTVDLTAAPYHRLLGLAKVEISTGGGQRDRLVLDSLRLREGRRLRAELLHRIDPVLAALPPPAPGTGLPVGRPTDAAPADTPLEADPTGADDEVLLRLDPRWIRYAPLTTTGLASAAAGFGVLTQGLTRYGEQGDAIVERARGVRGLAPWVDVIGVLALVSGLAAAAYVLTFWGFRLTRNRLGSLQTRRGLLTTRETSIDPTRVRGTQLEEPLGLRLAGARRLKVVTTGLLHERGGADWLCPPAPAATVTALAAQITPDQAAVDGPLTPHGAAARRRRLTRTVAPAVAVGGLLLLGRLVWHWPPVLLWLAPVLVVAAVALGLDRYRSLGHVVTDRHLVTRHGSLDRRRAVLDREGVIGWRVEQSFFQRRAGVATLKATTAAGQQHYDLVDVPLTQAYAVMAQVSPDLVSEFA
jgi:putative membrane protein